jgi:hypothetical protein
MITEITYTSKWAAIQRTVAELLVVYVTVGVLATIFLYRNLTPSDPECLTLIPVLAVFSAAGYFQYRKVHVFFDTLNFSIGLERTLFRKKHDIESLIASSQQYLANNRISFKVKSEKRPFICRIGEPRASFDLENLGLRLSIFYRSRSAQDLRVNFALGPVADEHDHVARKLLEDLRRELLRSE